MDDMFHLAVEACPAAMVMVGPDGAIELVNAECERMFGYPRGALIGAAIETLVPIRVRGGHQDMRDGFAVNPSKRLMGIGRDLHAVHADGSEFPVEIGLTPVTTAKGLSVLAFVIDITARREAEKSIRLYNEELERANEGLARFAYVASHDIQEPLRKIVAFAEILKSAIERDDRPDALHASEVMQNSALHARTLVADLLRFARAMNDEQVLEPISPPAVVDAALANLSQIVEEKNAEVRCDLEDFTVDADRTQFTLLVQNLIFNAIKYHRPGERPFVRIFTETTENGERRLVVEDHGIGFEPSHREEIFEPFKRLHSRDAYPGSGIGLAICRTVAKRHGWALSATSAPMRGARFEVRFGAAEAHRAPQESAAE